MCLCQDVFARALELAEARVGVFRSPAEKAAAAEARRKADEALAKVTEEEGKVCVCVGVCLICLPRFRLRRHVRRACVP